MNCTVEIAGEQLELLPERAVYWAAQKAIILADLHWGKSAHFRKAGIAMPLATQLEDANRLAAIIAKTKAEQLIIAGDLFHSVHNKEVDSFGKWRRRHSALQVDFVKGNHDILPQSTYEKLGLKTHGIGLDVKPFFISHDHLDDQENFLIHGHVHPGISIPGPGRNTHPAFFISQTKMVLPAFAQFTGFFKLKPKVYERIYAIGDGQVLRCK